MVFCNRFINKYNKNLIGVTILILIDGFLQFELLVFEQVTDKSHNPYFNRWFSAIGKEVVKKDNINTSQ
mgnify:CR=1 FL=1